MPSAEIGFNGYQGIGAEGKASTTLKAMMTMTEMKRRRKKIWLSQDVLLPFHSKDMKGFLLTCQSTAADVGTASHNFLQTLQLQAPTKERT